MQDIMDNAFNEKVSQGFYFEKCLSRKKQLVPIIFKVI
jgi:inorganic pyrophosphatase/exopolyphosphatase